jgi:OmcA/MtrC family decaheme c-type cytochrome
MKLLAELTALKKLVFILSLLVLTACGDGGSSTGNAATPAQGGSSIPSIDLSKTAAVTSASIDSNNILTVNFQLVDAQGGAISDLVADDLRFTIAKLEMGASSNLTGNWQSYFNKIEQPGVGEGTVAKLQAMQEKGVDGVLVNNNNGTYVYTFNRALNETQADILAQAQVENIDLTVKPSLTHRVALEIRNQPQPINTTLDWIPQTGKTQFDGVWGNNIVATQNCNTCHGALAAHGGSRTEVKYCVTCHNIGSSDANSGNTVNFKNMIHKIHRGKNLPSVLAGGKYLLYGFRDTEHNFSELSYPGDILTCNQCHAGTKSANKEQTITKGGDNWQEIATMQACGSCHDNVDFSTHLGGQKDNENCNSCHQNSAVAGAIADRHKNVITEAKAQFSAKIISITQTAAGQFPQIQFSIVSTGLTIEN